MTTLPNWIAFHRIARVGRVRFGALESHFGELKRAWDAPESELPRAARLDDRTVAEIVKGRADIEPMDELDRLERHRVHALTLA